MFGVPGTVGLDGVLQGHPAQQGALDTDRELRDPLKGDPVLQVVITPWLLPVHHLTEVLGQILGIVQIPPHHRLGHRRGAGHRDRAPVAVVDDRVDPLTGLVVGNAQA